MLTDIGTEELAHMEMICAIVHQLTRNLTPEEIAKSGFGSTLLVCGLTLIAFSIQGKKEEKDNVSTFAESTIVNKNETATVEEQEEVSINNEQPQNEETKA